MSKYHSGFNCLDFFHSFATTKKLKSNKNLCHNKDFCNTLMSSGDTKILEFNQKFDKAPFVIYPDLEISIKKIELYKVNSKN